MEHPFQMAFQKSTYRDETMLQVMARLLRENVALEAGPGLSTAQLMVS